MQTKIIKTIHVLLVAFGCSALLAPSQTNASDRRRPVVDSTGVVSGVIATMVPGGGGAMSPGGAGGSGWSTTAWRPYTVGAGGGEAVETICQKPGSLFRNDTDAVGTVWAAVTDTGTSASVAVWGGSGWLRSTSYTAETSMIVPARGLFCLYAESDRTQWRAGAFGSGLLETDYAKPVAAFAVPTVAGQCSMPATAGSDAYCGQVDIDTGNCLTVVPAAPPTAAYTTPSYRREAATGGVSFAIRPDGPGVTNYAGLAAAVGAIACR